MSFACRLQGLLPTDKRTQQMWWFPVAKIGIGAAAGVCAATLTYPLDTLRRRMEVNGALTHTKQVSTFACLRHMVQHEGVASLYRGCLVNCLKTAPSVALQVCPGTLPQNCTVSRPSGMHFQMSPLSDEP